MKKVCLLTICCLAIYYLPLHSQEVKQIKRLYQQGLRQIEQQQWENAQKTFETILSIDTNHAQSYFQLGKIYVKLNKPEQAETQFKQAIELDDKFAEAYHQLGLIHLETRNLDGRIKARKEFDQAVQLDPKNIEYWMSLAELYLRIGLDNYAQRICKKIAQQNSWDARSFYILGRIAEANMLKYKDMIDPDEGGVISLKEFAEEDYEEAVTMYNNAIGLRPDDINAYHRLAFIYFENSMLYKMQDVLQRAVVMDPDDKNGHLFLGFCYQKIGEYEFAYQEYEKARSLMTAEERSFFDSIEPVANPKIAKELQLVTANDRISFIHSFWKSRDPLYLTEYNERLLEHYSRVAYANLRFGRSEKGIEGWQTDRGQIYVRYGAPLSRTRTCADFIISIQGGQLIPSHETWNYEDFDFVFEDRFVTGDYLLKWGSSPVMETDYLDFFKEMSKKIPEIYEHDFGGKLIELPFYLANFRGDSGLTRVALCYALRLKDIGYTHYRKQKAAYFRRGIFFFTPDWDELVAVRDTISIQLPESYSTQVKQYQLKSHTYTLSDNQYILSWLSLPPSKYNFGLELQDLISDKIGIEHIEVHVKNYNYQKLQLSDILIGWGVNEPEKGKWMTPNSSKTFLSGKSFTIYYEIYNLKIDNANKTRFQIEETFERTEIEKQGIFRLFTGLGELIGISQKGESVSTSYIYEGDQAVEKISKSLQLNTDVTGEFRLQIKITDLNAQQEASKVVELMIVR